MATLKLRSINQRYSQVPFALRLLPKLFTFESLASRVPNWIAFFLKVDAFSSPSSRATRRSSIFSPLPSVSSGRGTVRRYSQSGRQRKGQRASRPFMPIARSSRPRLRIHSRSMSNTISLSISSYPARLNAIRQREQPAKISSAPSPEATILAGEAALARWRAAAMLKSMWVDLGQMARSSSFFTFSMSSIVRFTRIRLNCRLGFSARSSSMDTRAASRSGASSRKARFTRSICSSFGSVRSSSRAISVLSTPPEKSTAILAASFEELSKMPRMQRVISRTLSTSSLRTVATTPSASSGALCRPSLRRSSWRMGRLVQKASPLRRWMAMRELAGSSKSCFLRLASHSASYFTRHPSSFSSSPAPGSACSSRCSSSCGALVSSRWFSPIPTSRLRFPKQSFMMKIWSPSTSTTAQSPRICPSVSRIFSSDPLQPISVRCSHSPSFSPFSQSMPGRLPVSHTSPLKRKQEPGESGVQLCSPRRCSVVCTPTAKPFSSGCPSAAGWQLVLYMSMRCVAIRLGPRCASACWMAGRRGGGSSSLWCWMCWFSGSSSSSGEGLQAAKKLKLKWCCSMGMLSTRQIPHINNVYSRISQAQAINAHSRARNRQARTPDDPSGKRGYGGIFWRAAPAARQSVTISIN